MNKLFFNKKKAVVTTLFVCSIMILVSTAVPASNSIELNNIIVKKTI